jgi:small subunit ribosomal protein S15
MPRAKKETTKKPEKEVKKTASKVKAEKAAPKAKKEAPVKAAKEVKVEKEAKIAPAKETAKVKAEKPKNSGPKEDTGSVDFQIQNFSEKIKLLAKHLKSHAHDFDSRRGLLIMVGKRRRLLNYLKKSDPVKYEEVYKTLKLKA